MPSSGIVSSPDPPPTITQQPAAQNVCPGATATFTVAATGQGTLTYQWQKNQVNITNGGHYSGATTTTLTVSSADTSDAANYRCVVTNAGGSTNSNEAALTLKAATTITQHPSNQNVCPGRDGDLHRRGHRRRHADLPVAEEQGEPDQRRALLRLHDGHADGLAVPTATTRPTTAAWSPAVAAVPPPTRRP